VAIYTFLHQAVAVALQYPGQYSVVPTRRPAGDYGYSVQLGHHPFADYVTLGAGLR
jgi:hypothetical protein